MKKSLRLISLLLLCLLLFPSVFALVSCKDTRTITRKNKQGDIVYRQFTHGGPEGDLEIVVRESFEYEYNEHGLWTRCTVKEDGRIIAITERDLTDDPTRISRYSFQSMNSFEPYEGMDLDSMKDSLLDLGDNLIHYLYSDKEYSFEFGEGSEGAEFTLLSFASRGWSYRPKATYTKVVDRLKNSTEEAWYHDLDGRWILYKTAYRDEASIWLLETLIKQDLGYPNPSDLLSEWKEDEDGFMEYVSQLVPDQYGEPTITTSYSVQYDCGFFFHFDYDPDTDTITEAYLISPSGIRTERNSTASS